MPHDDLADYLRNVAEAGDALDTVAKRYGEGRHLPADVAIAMAQARATLALAAAVKMTSWEE